jgi:hypothetical protein
MRNSLSQKYPVEQSDFQFAYVAGGCRPWWSIGSASMLKKRSAAEQGELHCTTVSEDRNDMELPAPA